MKTWEFKTADNDNKMFKHLTKAAYMHCHVRIFLFPMRVENDIALCAV